jgi:hypothetical protein
MRNAARSGWELSRPEELIFELFRRPKGQACRDPCLASLMLGFGLTSLPSPHGQKYDSPPHCESEF